MSSNGTFEQSSRKFSQRRIMTVQWKIREKFILAWEKTPFYFQVFDQFFLALWGNFFRLIVKTGLGMSRQIYIFWKIAKTGKKSKSLEASSIFFLLAVLAGRQNCNLPVRKNCLRIKTADKTFNKIIPLRATEFFWYSNINNVVKNGSP